MYYFSFGDHRVYHDQKTMDRSGEGQAGPFFHQNMFAPLFTATVGSFVGQTISRDWR
jgi:hypothetical protein